MSEQKLSTVGEIVEIAEAGEGVECRIVPGYPDYAVGDDGSFWSRKNNRWGLGDTWKPKRCARSYGYPIAHMTHPGMPKRHAHVHTLVLELFVGPRPDGMMARHFPNPDRTDNRLCNLQWGTALENQRDRYVQGTDQFGERNPAAKLTEEQVVEIRELYATGKYLHKELAPLFGITRKAACQITNGGRWPKAGGPITDASSRRFRFDSETARQAKTGAKIDTRRSQEPLPKKADIA